MHQGSNASWAFARLLFIVILTSNVENAADTLVVVSDVDDTVKITDVLHPGHAFFNAVSSELVFAGMPELYSQMLSRGTHAEQLRFISGSPRVLAHKIRELLTESGFPSYNLTLRGFRESRSSALDYKTRHLKALYNASPHEFIFGGDDTESDPEVYTSF